MSWHESLRSGHCRHFYFLRVSKRVGWWTVIFQIKKSAVLMSSLPHPATFSFWSQCRIGPELCPLICGGNELINEFYSFWEENALSLKKNTNIFKKYFSSFVIVFSAGRRCCFLYLFLFSSVVKRLSHNYISWLLMNKKYHSAPCSRVAVHRKDWLVQSYLQEFGLYYPPLMLGKFKSGLLYY